MPRMVVTTSWDDGHILDMRLAELLREHDLAGTFYISPRDQEFSGHNRLSDAQVKELAGSFEIGAHTMTHPRLPGVDDAKAWLEITESKAYLERLTGSPVTSFCYPGGAHKQAHRKMAHDAGFTYVRGVERFNIGRPTDPMDAATTVHAYRHWSDIWDIAKFARWNPVKFIKYLSWDELAIALFDRAHQRGGVFHIWGHSWEIDRNRDWNKLQRVLRHISHRPDVSYEPNSQLVKPQPPTVLVTTPYFFPSVGGLEVYALNLARKLRDSRNWRVVVATTTGPGEAEGVSQIEGLTVHRLKATLKLSNTGWSFSWVRKLREIIAVEQPAVINAHGPVPGMAEATALAAGKRPFILTWHAGSMKKGQAISDFLTGIYQATGLPWLIHRATRTICSSDFVSDTVMAGNPEAVTIPPGVDTDMFTPAPNLAKDTILFVGGNLSKTTQYKGLWSLLNVMPRLQSARPGTNLIVVGDGDYRAEYEHYAREHSLNVTFTGVLHGSTVADVFRSARVYALPTTNDSYPTVILEAMASGLPVVSYPTGAIPQIVEDGATGTLTSEDKLGDSLLKYLADDELAAQHGTRGRERAVAQHSWNDRAAKSAQVLVVATRPEIVQVSAYYPPHIGGIENVMKELSSHLVTQGWRVRVLTSRLGRVATGASSNDQDAKPSSPDSPIVQRLPAFEILHTPIIVGLFRRLMTIPKRSVIHLHVAQALTPEITMIAAKLRRLPVVAHVHLDVDPSSRIGDIFFRPYKRIVLRRVLLAATKVIALSREQRDEIIHMYGLSPERVDVVPNGVSRSFFMPARQIPHDPLRLLYVGRLVVQKRPERLIDTAAKLGDSVHLDIVGDGEDRSKLVSMAFKYGLQNVTFHGVKRGDELRAFYAQADAFILPSDREGLPLVLLEALAGGLPIIGSDVMGIREHLRGIGMLVANPSSDTFTRAIKSLIASPAEYLRLSRQSASAAPAYSWDVLTTRLAVMYQELSA